MCKMLMTPVYSLQFNVSVPHRWRHNRSFNVSGVIRMLLLILNSTKTVSI